MNRLLILLGALLVSVAPAWAATVHLSWTASTTPEVTGYRIYYGTSAGVYTANVNAGLATTGTVGGLTAGTTYYMVVKAYIATNQESPASNEVTVPIVVAPPAVAPLARFIAPHMPTR